MADKSLSSPSPRPDPRLPAPARAGSEEYAISVRAEYYEGQIDVKQFRARFPHYPVRSSSPLVLEPEASAYIVLLRFGSVIYWDCSETVIQEFQGEIRSLPGVAERNDAVGDRLVVRVGGPEDAITFNDVWLRELTLEKLKIIALVLGQSVALDRFEIEVTRALEQFHPLMETLRRRGRLTLREPEALRAVGFALEVRAAVLANLTLFDDPPATWESEYLAHLDNELYDQFDLEERLSAINQKLDFLTDMNSTLTTLLSNRKSHRLEWIIIILIFVEIVLFVFSLDWAAVLRAFR